MQMGVQEVQAVEVQLGLIQVSIAVVAELQDKEIMVVDQEMVQTN